MAKRKIIKIDEEKCTGCGECIPNCPEGALRIIDGKARLISDLFCDGLGACIGHCPEGAISVEEREAQAYDEKMVMENIAKQGKNVIRAHLEHLREHGQERYLQEAIAFLKEKNITIPREVEAPASAPEQGRFPSPCPGSKVMDFRKQPETAEKSKPAVPTKSQLRQWPVQIMLVPADAPYFQGADLLIAADCVPFAYAGFHEDLLKDKVLLVGCPKLDDISFYQEKLRQIFTGNEIKSITVAHMEVPCCFGLVSLVREALAASGKDIPLKGVIIGIKGERR